MLLFWTSSLRLTDQHYLTRRPLVKDTEFLDVHFRQSDQVESLARILCPGLLVLVPPSCRTSRRVEGTED